MDVAGETCGRPGTLPGDVRSGATFADAAAEWLRYVSEDRGREAVDADGLQAGGLVKAAAGVRVAAD